MLIENENMMKLKVGKYVKISNFYNLEDVNLRIDPEKIIKYVGFNYDDGHFRDVHICVNIFLKINNF